MSEGRQYTPAFAEWLCYNPAVLQPVESEWDGARVSGWMFRRAVCAMFAIWIAAIGVRAASAQQQTAPPPPATPAASPAADRSTLAGVYSAKQSARGEDDFGSLCTGCHTTASHSGPSFKKRWEGSTVWDLLATISETMPKDDEGSLTLDQCTDLVAYLLKLNGLPAGDKDMPQDEASLSKIKIELPKTDPGGRPRRSTSGVALSPPRSFLREVR